MKLKDYSYNPRMASLVNLAELEQTAKGIPALQCPFCGGDPEIQLTIFIADAVGISVTCSGCGISTPRLLEGQTITGNNYTLQDRLQEAVRIWSRRV